MVRKALLQKTVHLAVSKRRRVFAVWAALCLASVAVLGAKGLRIDTSRQAMVSEDNVHSRRYQTFLREFGTPLHLVVVIEGKDPSVNRAYADALAKELRKETETVGDVLYRVNYDVMRSYALLYAPLSQLTLLRSRLQAAADTLGAKEPSEETVTFEGLTGAIAQGNEALGRLEEGDTEGWGRMGDLAGRADELNGAMATVFRVLREALTEDDWTDLRLVESVGTTELASAGIDSQGYLSARGGELQFLFVQPAKPSEQVSFLVPLVRTVTEAAQRLRPDGVEVGLTGSPAFVVEEMAQIRHDMLVTGALSLVGVLLLFLLAYGSLVNTVLVFIPLAAGVLVTVAVVALAIGRLNLITSMFFAILVGLGIDFGIHLLSRFTESAERGRSLEEALVDTLESTGPGVVTGAITTVAAFFAMMITEFTAMQELGFIAGLGVLLVLAATMTLLPCLLATRFERASNRGAPVASAPRGPVGTRLAPLIRRPVPVLAVIFASCLGLAYTIKPVRFDFDVKQFLPHDSPALKTYQKLEESEFYNPDFAVMVADSLAVAREWTKKLEERSDVVARIESLATYLPTEQDAKRPVVSDIKALARRFPRLVLDVPAEVSAKRLREDLAKMVEYLEVDVPLTLEMHGLAKLVPGAKRAAAEARETLDALAEVPDDALARRLLNFDRRTSALLSGLQGFVRSDQLSVGPADLPKDLLDQYYRNADGKEQFVVRVFPKGNIADPEFMERFKAALVALYPETTGYPITFLEFGLLFRDGLATSALYALIAIVLLVFLDFRRVTDTLLALFPLLLGTLVMVGAMNVLEIGYNFANLMSIPLILGIGIDSGIHIVHRYRSGVRPTEVVATAGRAVTISSLTTMVSFGTMIFADHRGMESLGLTLLIGVGACLLMAVLALPAYLELMERWRARRSA